jgi:hypothetical protein
MPQVIRTLSPLEILLTISACQRAADDPKPDPEPSVVSEGRPNGHRRVL